MKNIKIPAQIMVVVLLVLSILSIFAVVIVSNTRREVSEQVQNKQYQQYYSITEKKMLELQNEIGIGSLDPDRWEAGLNLQTGLGEDCTPPSDQTVTCSFTEQGSELEVDTADVATLTITVEDSGDLSNFPLAQDKTLLINLDNSTATGYRGNINLSFTGSVSMVLSLDFQDNGTSEYRMVKDVVDSAGLFASETHCSAQFNTAAQTLTFNVGTFLSNCVGAGNFKTISLRFKPLNGDATVSLTGDADLPQQFRNIRGVSYSQANISSPVTILELNYPLASSPLGILDYVLRTEQQITK